MNLTGWLFDLYPKQSRMVLWFITPAGEKWRVEDDFPYRFYLQGDHVRLRRLGQAWESRGWVRRAYSARKQDLEGRESPVLAVELRGYEHLRRLRAWLGKQQDLTCYNCDLDLAAYYLYTKQVWPCAWYDLEVKDGRLQALTPLEEQFALDFSLPLLTTLHLGLAQDPLIPLGAGNTITLGWEGRTLILEAPDRGGLVAEVAHLLKRSDPDLILSEWGDEKIIPRLWQWSRKERVPLPLDREAGPVSREFTGGRSYFSYGRIVYQGAAAPCYGRWHVDRRNSFYYREAGLHGLIQIARLGQMSLQQAARASPGTLITSMQLARAVADGILIPWRKGESEHFKTAGDLLRTDKGGLVFMPPVGVHFQVAELDFASMYPTIMMIHNLSPETVNCSCCPGERVPEAGYRICRRREGLVPRTLRPILTLREQLKAQAKVASPEEAVHYKERQNALKWMLVTCFGYLGYKNARFGRIEAHEAVTAYGRDKLLTAKEVCEAAGFTMLHGLTDCLWVEKAGLDDAELEELCREICAVTGVKLALEGIYRWIVFPASRQNPKRPVATRYFGVFQDGTLKVRGLMCRRRDTPPLVRQAQEALLNCLTDAATREDLVALRPKLADLAAAFRQRLREGELNPQDLVITRVLSQPPEDYQVDTPTALAARQLQSAGVHLLPGEKVRYVHQEAKRGTKETRILAAPFITTLDAYDTDFYLELLNRAIGEVLQPLSEIRLIG